MGASLSHMDSKKSFVLVTHVAGFAAIAGLIVSAFRRKPTVLAIDWRIELRPLCKVTDLATGMMLGIAVGDALGIPWENKSLSDLQQRGVFTPFNQKGQKSKRSGEEIYQKCGSDHTFLPDYPAGKWTDDTQLSLAMARAITPLASSVSSHALDWEKVVDEHVKEWQISVQGWGNSQYAIEKLYRKSHTYKNSGADNSTGNGVLMKIVPLAFFYAHHKTLQQCDPATLTDQQIEDIVNLTRMTHATPSAVVTSLLLVLMAQRIFRDPSLLSTKESRVKFLEELIVSAKAFEDKFIPKHLVKLENDFGNPLLIAYNRSITKISPHLNTIRLKLEESMRASPPISSPSSPSPLSSSNNHLSFETFLCDEDLSSLCFGGTFFCVDSLLMVTAILMSSKPSFLQIERAAKIGGDTDSNAAIVGGIVGGILGVNIFGESYVKPLYQSDMVARVGISLGKGLSPLQKS